MLPDGNKMLLDVPDALHVAVADRNGDSHDAVLVEAYLQNDLTDYGISRRGDGDTVYVAQPFVPPENRVSLTVDGVVSVRRITRVNKNPVFVILTVGEDIR